MITLVCRLHKTVLDYFMTLEMKVKATYTKDSSYRSKRKTPFLFLMECVSMKYNNCLCCVNAKKVLGESDFRLTLFWASVFFLCFAYFISILVLQSS